MISNNQDRQLRCDLCKAPAGVKGITLLKVKDKYYCKGCYKFLVKYNFKIKEK